MPKIVSGKNDTPLRIGKAINLIEWLDETETVKQKDGTEVTRLKNVSEEIASELKAGTQVKGKDADKDRVMSITSPNFTLAIEIAKRRIPANKKDGKPYEMEYASLLPNVIEACAQLVEGNTDITFTKDKDGKETEAPSVTKYFRQGFGMLARNNASAEIAREVEGPAKGIEQAIKGLMRSRGWTYEKAKAKLAAMDAD